MALVIFPIPNRLPSQEYTSIVHMMAQVSQGSNCEKMLPKHC